MKPLFLTYTTGKDPYLTFANKLEEDIKNLNAGDFFHLKIEGPGNNMNFYAEVSGLLYPYISRAINWRPVVMLDCDHGLKAPIDHLFKGDWDVATVFRYPQLKEWGRQDYCAGLVALNNKRPNVVKNFWIEWTYKTNIMKQHDPMRFPKALKDNGWGESWFTDQVALNQIILPDGNQQEPEKDDYLIVAGNVYEAHGYRVLPLKRRVYGALPGDSRDAFIIHYKGKTKAQRIK